MNTTHNQTFKILTRDELCYLYSLYLFAGKKEMFSYQQLGLLCISVFHSNLEYDKNLEYLKVFGYFFVMYANLWNVNDMF